MCGHIKYGHKEKALFIELYRPAVKKKISFQDLFNESEHFMSCESIGCFSNQFITTNIYDFKKLKYLIILIKLTNFINNKVVRLEVEITDFNPDEVIINETKFRTLAVVFHYKITEESAHFICFKRINNYWIYISDEISYISENLNNLKDAYYFVLGKI